MKSWPGRRASVLDCGSPLPLSPRTAAASKVPEDWRSPKAPAPSPRRLDCIPAAKRADAGTAKGGTGIFACASAATQTRLSVSQWEREIDERVYRLYGLTPEEIKFVEETSK